VRAIGRMRSGLALLLLGISGCAFGHAFLDHAAPPVGSTLSTAPDRVRLWFTQQLEPAFSGIEVDDANGARVDDGKVTLDPNDATSLSVGLKPLGPGTYTVRWHVVSVDTHRTEGTLTFEIAK
jgi:methionine-rich copper-binding protein CopC